MEAPADLRCFDASSWTFEEWSAARREWAAVNGWLGGIVQLLAEEVAVRRGRPMPPSQWPYWCPPAA
ncbi:MAG: hypothetical protein H0T66_11540 [Geodermatophilaceae bacterium]|nr:hypothetical protein [Geodermatophilaceae bacterium]MDQ3456863.1 hypothetical protein [Actinomycetota bacterium]